jgi:hypothetical protein
MAERATLAYGCFFFEMHSAFPETVTRATSSVTTGSYRGVLMLQVRPSCPWPA